MILLDNDIPRDFRRPIVHHFAEEFLDFVMSANDMKERFKLKKEKNPSEDKNAAKYKYFFIARDYDLAVLKNKTGQTCP